MIVTLFSSKHVEIFRGLEIRKTPIFRLLWAMLDFVDREMKLLPTRALHQIGNVHIELCLS